MATDFKHWGCRTNGWGAMTSPVGAATDLAVARANLALAWLCRQVGIENPAAARAAAEGVAAARARHW